MALFRILMLEGFGAGKLDISVTPAPDTMSLMSISGRLNAARSEILSASDTTGPGSATPERKESRKEDGFCAGLSDFRVI